MALIDEQVNAWLIEKFLDSTKYSYSLHGDEDEISVIKADAAWECLCWSDWTRDDSFELTALLSTRAGEVSFRYGAWAGLPQFIYELDEYINGNDCYYESEEYRDGSD